MNIDEIKIDPNTLRFLSAYIHRHIEKQQDLLRDYSNKIKKLSNNWSDNKGYDEMMKNIEIITKNYIESLDRIDRTYRKFLYDEVMDIERTLATISGKF